MLNTQVVSGASDQDMVVLDLVFMDETFTTAGPLLRWQAKLEMLKFRDGPFEPVGKWVHKATIWEYQEEQHVPLDYSKPVH